MRNDRVYLNHILEAIDNIDRYASRGREAFEEDELIQVWIIHQVQIIGEATRNLSEALRGDHPEVPWGQIAAMRNVLVHDYSNLDLDAVWLAVEDHIPTLKDNVNSILEDLEG